jgi:anaerobic selenocysteine-containing dehydrogenase
VLYDSGCEFRLNLDPLMRPDWREAPARVLNMTDLATALTAWDDPPLEFLYVHGTNPAATAPEQGFLERGLLREDLFTVVHERFPTDTVRFADVVLPAPTFVETDDLVKSYGHLYLQMGRAALPPLGECRPNLETFQALGRALGYEDPWFTRSVDDFVRLILAATADPNFHGLDPERVLRGETLRLNLPRGAPGFADRFRTPSGKLEFYSRALEEAGLPPMPGWRGDPVNDDPERHPFRLLTPPAHHFLNASFGPVPDARRRMGGEPRIMIHPADAERAGVADGEMVEIQNDLGSLTIVAQVTPSTQPGVLVAEGTWWPWHGRSGRGINALTSSRLSDLGGGSTFHDNRVALKKLGTARTAPEN